MTDGVDLADDMERFVSSLLRDGAYATRDEALREGARLLQARQARLTRFDAEVMKGGEDAEAGRSEDAEIMFARLKAKYQAVRPKAA